MRQSYRLKASTTQTVLVVGLYSAAALVWCYTLDSAAMRAGILLLCGLLAVRHIGLQRKYSTLILEFEPQGSGILLRGQGQPHFYAKYKVYPCRWFAILRLIDNSNSRSLILYPDCFTTPSDYRDLRYQLRAAEARDAA